MLRLTLDDGQEDDNDEEEEGDVKQDAVELIRVTSWVLDLIPNTSSCPNPNVHVEQVTLYKYRESECLYQGVFISQNKMWSILTVIMSSHFMSGSSSSTLLL